MHVYEGAFTPLWVVRQHIFWLVQNRIRVVIAMLNEDNA